ncbi:uncharacterized protein LOC135844105 [Planococcus citri]|uniref:uncharacterized protein LOC135844105 n=1 Tax=Planococcus citri TaxID=170843 RepID=UPI0031F74FE2
MKSIVLLAVFSSALVFVLGAPELSDFQKEVLKKEEEAAKYCKTIYPVNEDIRKKLGLFVAKGETIPKYFNTTEWCNLHCNLERTGFFDASGKMQVRKIFKYMLKSIPEIAPNSHTLLISLFQNARSTNGMEDKCEKAFVAYYRFTEAVMIATLAIDLNAQTDVREKVVESVLTGEELPKELETSIEKYLKNAENFFSQTIKPSPSGAPAAAPVS